MFNEQLSSNVSFHSDENTNREQSSSEVPSSPHEYDTVSDIGIHMNQLEIGTEATINYMEDEEEENNDALENDPEYTSERDAQPYLVTSDNYSSLMGTQAPQHQLTIYRELRPLATVVPVV